MFQTVKCNLRGDILDEDLIIRGKQISTEIAKLKRILPYRNEAIQIKLGVHKTSFGMLK